MPAGRKIGAHLKLVHGVFFPGCISLAEWFRSFEVFQRATSSVERRSLPTPNLETVAPTGSNCKMVAAYDKLTICLGGAEGGVRSQAGPQIETEELGLAIAYLYLSLERIDTDRLRLYSKYYGARLSLDIRLAIPTTRSQSRSSFRKRARSSSYRTD